MIIVSTCFNDFFKIHTGPIARTEAASAASAVSSASAEQLVELRNRVGGTLEQKDVCLQTLRSMICEICEICHLRWIFKSMLWMCVFNDSNDMQRHHNMMDVRKH